MLDTSPWNSDREPIDSTRSKPNRHWISNLQPKKGIPSVINRCLPTDTCLRATALGLALTGCCVSASRAVADDGADSRRPNILFLLTDDQRWDTLGCMGNEIIQTPNLDALATDGAIFENAFVTTSVCWSSRASYLTGLYSSCHGVGNKPLSPSLLQLTYLARLRKTGYHIGFIGKYGVHGTPTELLDYDRTFPGQGHYSPRSKSAPSGQLRPLTGPHLTTIMADQAIEYLSGRDGKQPFCLSISFKSPHCQDGDPRQFLYDPDLENLYGDVKIPVPETAAPKYFQRLPESVRRGGNRKRWEFRFATPEMHQQMVKAYYRLITGVDRAVGRIRQALEEYGMADNTVIVFAGDNGFFLGEHGLAGKWIMYEESIRVPLFIYDPRLPSELRGQRRTEMALNIDVAPTILSLAGVPVPAAMQGRSLFPLINNQSTQWRHDWIFEGNGQGIRTDDWKYIRFGRDERLFDLRSDPIETENLANHPDHQQRLEAMRSRWQTWRDSLKAWQIDKPSTDEPRR